MIVKIIHFVTFSDSSESVMSTGAVGQSAADAWMSNGLLTPFDLSLLLTSHTFFTYYSFVSMQLIFHSCRAFHVTVTRICFLALCVRFMAWRQNSNLSRAVCECQRCRLPLRLPFCCLLDPGLSPRL